MKGQYEDRYRISLPRRTYTIIPEPKVIEAWDVLMDELFGLESR